MKKLISRVCCLCCVVLVLAACLPFSAFAVDPVSAGVMANAFAQAIAAYGASNGVAMTFDVTSTDGIGESVHELWKDFREGTQSADDYATLAAALFPDLYYKASSAVAGAADVYTVGYNISSTYAEEFDNFYNWLLSGPAEMVKVDNQYYQFSNAQIGPNSSPIVVYSYSELSSYSVPYADSALTDAQLSSVGGLIFSQYWSANDERFVTITSSSNSSPVYGFWYSAGSSWRFTPVVTDTSISIVVIQHDTYGNGSYSRSVYRSYTSDASYPGLYYVASGPFVSKTATGLSLSYPSFSSVSDGLSILSSLISSGGDPSSVGVKSYNESGVASFPDTTDPNYEAVGKQIPSTVPWDNTAYGDGTGTLTDAQAGAIAAGADTAIARDGVLDLAGTDEVTDEPGVDDPPTTDPDDYAVPGLAEIFPFCIPFDIYNFLSALAANPVAPHFTATLDFPEAVGGTQTIDIDFDSPTWNQLAQLLRLLELLAFIIGLALLTRSMFIRG